MLEPGPEDVILGSIQFRFEPAERKGTGVFMQTLMLFAEQDKEILRPIIAVDEVDVMHFLFRPKPTAEFLFGDASVVSHRNILFNLVHR